MNVQRGSKRSGARRHDQRVQNDLPDHQTECVQQELMLPIDMARDEGAHGSEDGGDQKWRVVEFLERRFRHDSKQQRGQRNIEQKEVHPCQTRFRQTLGPATGEANEDQAEIRQRQVENVDHGDTSFSSLLAPDRQRGGPAKAKVKFVRLPLASATMMVYSTRYDKSADRQISDRTDRPPPDLLVPGRDLRYRSGIQQYRGMVVVDPRRCPASQGSAVLSSARREFGIGIRRLRLRAEPIARQFRRADPAFASRRDFREGQVGQLPPAQSFAELNCASSKAS